MKNNICISCGNRTFKVLEYVKKSQFSFHVSQCSKCRLAFQDPIPDRVFLQKLYKNIYRKKHHFISTETAFEDIDVKKEKDRIRYIEQFRKGGKLLDVGASTGFFLSELAKHSVWKGFGIEYEKKAVQVANKKFGLSIQVGEITHSTFKDNEFDVITMFSVLEHIPNQLDALRAVNKQLKKGGIFVFNVPNIASYEYQIFKTIRRSFPGFIIEHLFYYTPYAITNMLKKTGFNVITMTSDHYTSIKLPPIRPFIGVATFPLKYFFEYTQYGGNMNYGNVLFIVAQKR